MSLFETVLNAHWHVLGADILYREIVGNLFGLASAVGGMRRKLWAWPIGIVGNVLLFTVFLGGVFNTPQDKDLYGQAGRQVMFAAVSIYGFWQWRQASRAALTANDAEGAPVAPPVRPHFAGWNGWMQIVLIGVGGTALFWWVFSQIGSFGPLADAWIFTGSFLATYGMARGWNEFWLIWVGVDAVGVPLLLRAGYYPSAILYGVYGGFVIWGFVVWLRTQRRDEAVARTPETTKALTGKPVRAWSITSLAGDPDGTRTRDLRRDRAAR